MSQPIPYTPTTDFSQQESINASGRSTVNTAALDAELANIETTLDLTLYNLSLIQRDDGVIADGAVTVESISQEALNILGSFNVRGDWAPATAYAQGDVATHIDASYACNLSHTSGGAWADTNWSRLSYYSSADVIAAHASELSAAASAALADAAKISAEASSVSAAASLAQVAIESDAAAASALSASSSVGIASGHASAASVSASASAASAIAADISAASADAAATATRTSNAQQCIIGSTSYSVVDTGGTSGSVQLNYYGVYSFANGVSSSGELDSIGYGGVGTPQTWSGLTAAPAPSTITFSSKTATITFATNHNLETGTILTVLGASPAAYNGTFEFTKTGASTGTYQMLTVPATNATVVGSCKVTNFLILQYNPATEPPSYTLLSSTLPMKRVQWGTIPNTLGLHTYDVAKMQMYVGDGSAYAAVQRLFVGECDVDAGGLITNKRSYSIGNTYQTDDPYAFAVSTAYTWNHNFGVIPATFRTRLVCVIAEHGYVPGDEVEFTPSNAAANTGGSVSATRNSITTAIGTNVYIIPKTGGAYVLITVANWKLKTYAERGW